MKFAIGVICVALVIAAGQALPPCACPKNLEPTCGTDGITYSNPCVLKCVNFQHNSDVTIAHMGACMAEFAFTGQCKLYWDEMCGSDGHTYENGCLLDKASHMRNGELKMLHRGSCTLEEEKELRKE